MRSLRRRVVAFAFLVGGLAHADLIFGTELAGTLPGERLEGKYNASLGLLGSIAYPIAFASVEVRPAFALGYSRFANPRDDSRPVWFYRAALGGDLRYPGFVLKPLVGAHYGYAWGNGKTLNTAYVSGTTYDWEVGVDYPLETHIEVGARLRRVTIAGDEADDARFWTAGLFAALAY
jgi:hypothetical protein